MTLPKVTAEDVLSWGPCWLGADGGECRVRRALTQLGEEFDALDVLGLAEVSPDDRLWVVLREEMIPAKTLRIFGCRCARQALDREREAGREPDARSWAAVDAAERYARGGATDDELTAAGIAARSAFWKVRGISKLAAVAAWNATFYDAGGAARDTIRGARCQWQVATIIEMLTEAKP